VGWLRQPTTPPKNFPEVPNTYYNWANFYIGGIL
jgi:hypothetical protein